MKAKIITIGDEIIIGQIVDTNSVWISSQLNEMGIRVVSRLSVGDQREDIERAVVEAMNSSGIVILTGGLGPTKDDITKKTLCGIFDCELVRDEQTYRWIESMMLDRGMEFNLLNQSQALVPDGCTLLHNANGTAPGMWFERNGSLLISLPGVPFEMRALMEEQVLPRIKQRFELRSIVHKSVATMGIPESALAMKIEEWESALPPHLRLAYLPSTTGVELRISAYDVQSLGAEREIEEQFARLAQIIPEYILDFGAMTVEGAVARLLSSKRATLSVAESCTGGAIASRFTAMAGASEYFLGGVIAYSNQIKVDLLSVSSNDIESYGVVSSEVVEQMAIGVCRITGSDYSVATTGIAGPNGGSEDKPVGTLWIGVATKSGTVVSQKLSLGALRGPNIERASSHAINLLRSVVKGDVSPNSYGVVLYSRKKGVYLHSLYLMGRNFNKEYSKNENLRNYR